MPFSDILGHERPLRVLRRTLASGRVPHAYLFWGPDGVGKERVALELARVLLCRDPGALGAAEACGGCPGCRKVGAGSHPDLHLLAPQGARISVAEVRALQESLSFRAFEGGRKVAIIRDGSRLTREAANALLKTLEEPPEGTHIFLLAHHRDQLLPTLVSRCQGVRFDPIPVADVERLLTEQGVEPGLARVLAQASGGRPGAVLGDGAERFAETVREAEDLVGRWGCMSVADRLRTASAWASERELLGPRLDALEQVLGARIRETAGADPALLDRQQGVLRVRRWIDQNANVELALDALLLGLAGPDWEDRWHES